MQPYERLTPDGANGGMRAELALSLTIRDLGRNDLYACGWSGTPHHLVTVAAALDRADAGEVDYLVVCLPSGSPVAIGGVDFTKFSDAGYLWQLAVNPAFQRCGIGTVLVCGLEERILRRGRRRAELDYEADNEGNRAFYERLGYTPYGTIVDGWNQQRSDGSLEWYEATCVQMRRDLTR